MIFLPVKFQLYMFFRSRLRSGTGQVDRQATDTDTLCFSLWGGDIIISKSNPQWIFFGVSLFSSTWSDIRGKTGRLNKQEAQLMLKNPRDVFRGQSRSPNIVPFHMLDIVSSCAIITLSLRCAGFPTFDLEKCHDLEIR